MGSGIPRVFFSHAFFLLDKPTNLIRIQVSNEKKTGCLGCIGDYTSQLYWVLISQYKDPYKPTSIMESNQFFFRGSGVST